MLEVKFASKRICDVGAPAAVVAELQKRVPFKVVVLFNQRISAVVVDVRISKSTVHVNAPVENHVISLEDTTLENYQHTLHGED